MLRRQQILFDCQLWEIERNHSFEDATKTAWSHCLVCPACGHTWATISFPDDRLIWPRSAFCGCFNYRDEWHPVPGSLLVEEGYGRVDEELLYALPPDLLRREFDLHMKVFSNA